MLRYSPCQSYVHCYENVGSDVVDAGGLIWGLSGTNAVDIRTLCLSDGGHGRREAESI